jgi:hypothetical protein
LARPEAKTGQKMLMINIDRLILVTVAAEVKLYATAETSLVRIDIAEVKRL